jgi:hypothetical protein
MSVVMQMHWPEVSTDLYEQAREGVAWEDDRPDGAIFHVAWVGDDGFHVLDVWESEEQFGAFADSRLMPIVKGKLGIPGEPDVTFAPAVRWYDARHGDIGT